MKKYPLMLSMIVLVLFSLTVPVFAQGGDRDGDGIPDRVDRCPAEPGPGENNGCPLPTTGERESGGAPDRDGDGVPDFVDACPDAPATGFTEGCPDETANEPLLEAPVAIPPAVPQILMVWQNTTTCLVANSPALGVNVNIRDQAAMDAAIIAQLVPGQQFAPFFRDYDAEGNVWYGGAPAGNTWGWVFGAVVIDNGQCDNLPMIIHVDVGSLPVIDLVPASDAPGVSPVAFEIQIGTSDLQNAEFDQPTMVTIPDIILSSYQSSASADGGVEHTDSWYENTFFAIPVQVNRHEGLPFVALQPLLFIQPVNPSAPKNCTDLGGYCLLGMLLLPAIGDAPDRCPEQAFEDALNVAFPDDTQGVSGRGVDIARVDGQIVPGQALPKLLEAAVKGKVFLKNHSFYVNTSGDEAGDGAAPFGLLFTSDEQGSSETIGLEFQKITPTYTATQDGKLPACSLGAFVPTDGAEAAGEGSVRILSGEVFVKLPPA